MKDIYLYENSSILVNRLNIRDSSILADAEADYVSMRLRELAEIPLKGHYDVSHFLRMHQYIFQEWKIHAFREGNTRTTITFMCQYADANIKNIDRQLFEENSAYVRTALVAYNAYFRDGSNFQKKNYLEDIVYDALFG